MPPPHAASVPAPAVWLPTGLIGWPTIVRTIDHADNPLVTLASVPIIRISRTCIALALLTFFSLPLGAAENRLVAEFWAERQPLIRPEGDYPVRREAALEQILREAQWTFSGMVYGYRFYYRPFDRARQVPEQFQLELHAEIPWGDSSLSVLTVRHADARYYAQLQYRMADFQVAWVDGWQSRAIPRSAAAGEAVLWPGLEQKRAAVEDALRMAVREHLRTISPNKPHSATGRLILTAPPRIWIDSGVYRSSVEIKVRVDEVAQYEYH